MTPTESAKVSPAYTATRNRWFALKVAVVYVLVVGAAAAIVILLGSAIPKAVQITVMLVLGVGGLISALVIVGLKHRSRAKLILQRLQQESFTTDQPGRAGREAFFAAWPVCGVLHLESVGLEWTATSNAAPTLALFEHRSEDPSGMGGTHTTVAARAVTGSWPNLAIVRRGWRSVLLESISGGHQTVTGDAAFDARWEMRSDDKAAALRLLQDVAPILSSAPLNEAWYVAHGRVHAIFDGVLDSDGVLVMAARTATFARRGS